MSQLSGRVAVVTGANQGIGKAIARALGGEGAAVVLCARNGEKLGRVVDDFRQAGADVLGQACDVSRHQPPFDSFCEAHQIPGFAGVPPADGSLPISSNNQKKKNAG